MLSYIEAVERLKSDSHLTVYLEDERLIRFRAMQYLAENGGKLGPRPIGSESNSLRIWEACSSLLQILPDDPRRRFAESISLLMKLDDFILSAQNLETSYTSTPSGKYITKLKSGDRSEDDILEEIDYVLLLKTKPVSETKTVSKDGTLIATSPQTNPHPIRDLTIDSRPIAINAAKSDTSRQPIFSQPSLPPSRSTSPLSIQSLYAGPLFSDSLSIYPGASFAGWILKARDTLRGLMQKHWNPRWAIVVGQKLFYFESKSDPPSKCRGVIDLGSHVQLQPLVFDGKNHVSASSIPPGRNRSSSTASTTGPEFDSVSVDPNKDIDNMSVGMHTTYSPFFTSRSSRANSTHSVSELGLIAGQKPLDASSIQVVCSVSFVAMSAKEVLAFEVFDPIKKKKTMFAVPLALRFTSDNSYATKNTHMPTDFAISLRDTWMSVLRAAINGDLTAYPASNQVVQSPALNNRASRRYSIPISSPLRTTSKPEEEAMSPQTAVEHTPIKSSTYMAEEPLLDMISDSIERSQSSFASETAVTTSETSSTLAQPSNISEVSFNKLETPILKVKKNTTGPESTARESSLPTKKGAPEQLAHMPAAVPPAAYVEILDKAVAEIKRLANHEQSASDWDYVGCKSDVLCYRTTDGSPGAKGECYIPFNRSAILELLTDLERRGALDAQYDHGYTVEELDEQTKIIYLSFKGKAVASPRDFCLLAHYRIEENGDLIVVTTSIEHPKIPLVKGKVRATMSVGGWVIRPLPGPVPTLAKKSGGIYTLHSQAQKCFPPSLLRYADDPSKPLAPETTLYGAYLSEDVKRCLPPAYDPIADSGGCWGTYVFRCDFGGAIPKFITAAVTSQQASLPGDVRDLLTKWYGDQGAEHVRNGRSIARGIESDASYLANVVFRMNAGQIKAAEEYVRSSSLPAKPDPPQIDTTNSEVTDPVMRESVKNGTENLVASTPNALRLEPTSNPMQALSPPLSANSANLFKRAADKLETSLLCTPPPSRPASPASPTSGFPAKTPVLSRLEEEETTPVAKNKHISESRTETTKMKNARKRTLSVAWGEFLTRLQKKKYSTSVATYILSTAKNPNECNGRGKTLKGAYSSSGKNSPYSLSTAIAFANKFSIGQYPVSAAAYNSAILLLIIGHIFSVQRDYWRTFLDAFLHFQPLALSNSVQSCVAQTLGTLLLLPLSLSKKVYGIFVSTFLVHIWIFPVLNYVLTPLLQLVASRAGLSLDGVADHNKNDDNPGNVASTLLAFLFCTGLMTLSFLLTRATSDSFFASSALYSQSIKSQTKSLVHFAPKMEFASVRFAMNVESILPNLLYKAMDQMDSGSSGPSASLTGMLPSAIASALTKVASNKLHTLVKVIVSKSLSRPVEIHPTSLWPEDNASLKNLQKASNEAEKLSQGPLPVPLFLLSSPDVLAPALWNPQVPSESGKSGAGASVIGSVPLDASDAETRAVIDSFLLPSTQDGEWDWKSPIGLGINLLGLETTAPLDDYGAPSTPPSKCLLWMRLSIISPPQSQAPPGTEETVMKNQEAVNITLREIVEDLSLQLVREYGH